ncbi:MAG: pyruvate kinase [Saprospiraceae bacterium]|nr:pyruvate kinase [Bacteroidia bacterium]NNE13685.1 pyruvate kinase [Saprospiraceae bacterium]NNL90788.1 pyruvate kinase [Saprospiraceae bacterium]
MKINNNQKTKIVATVGPASSSKENLYKLIEAGVDIFRLNFSHGSHEDHLKVIRNITDIQETYDVPIGILGDLQGPKIRVGQIENGTLELLKGDILTFVPEKCIGNRERIYMSYENFSNDVEVGNKILVDDGKLELIVTEIIGKKVKLRVVHGTQISSNKGVNLPDTKISQPSLTEKDKKDLAFMLTQPINWIALSFVRKASDIIELKEIIAEASHYAKVIAKIEKPEAISNIKQIVNASDAVMVARGDLGVEVPMEKLPGLQKEIIRRCLQKSTPVIVATQMMESMIIAPSPTRAEITDVANAVLDGADAVMLSGETSVGKHPPLVVKAMNKIIAEAENHYELIGKRPKPNKDSVTYHSDTICLTAAKIAEDTKAKAILGVTVSGYTAFRVSSYRPKTNIYIFSSVRPMLGTMNLIWGVRAYFYDKFSSTDETIEDLCEILKEKELLKEGDVVINTASMPLHKRFRTNTLKITLVE